MSAHEVNATALVTRASMGIGAVHVDRLSNRGYDLILVTRSGEKLSEVAARLKATGRTIETIPADLTKAVDVQRVADRQRTDSSIAALVDNAGIGSAGKLLDSNVDDLESMIYLNVAALTRLAIAALQGFVARENWLLINIASVVTSAPERLNGSYGDTKAGSEPSDQKPVARYRIGAGIASGIGAGARRFPLVCAWGNSTRHYGIPSRRGELS